MLLEREDPNPLELGIMLKNSECLHFCKHTKIILQQVVIMSENFTHMNAKNYNQYILQKAVALAYR